MSSATKPVWRSVVLGTALLSGYFYGLDKQQGLYVAAKNKVEHEQKMIAQYQEEFRQELLKKEAEARGEDVSVYGVQPGLRGLAKSFAKTRSATASTETAQA